MTLDLLLIAPGCDASDVGESWVGHQWVRRLGERHRVTLLTYHKRDRTPPSAQLDGVRVVEWPDVPWVGKAERFDSLLKPGWLPFYVRARRWVREQLRSGTRFDLAHQLLPVAMRYPCPVAGLGLPYVVGPVGGSLASPAGFGPDEGTTPWYQRLRTLDQRRLEHDPWLRHTFEQADCVLGIAPYVRDSLAHLRLRRFEIMSETGLESLPEPNGAKPRSRVVRLLYVGRIVRTKGLRDTIRAVALVPAGVPVQLDVVGDGFDRPACEALARQLGVADRVRFHGTRPRAEVDAFYRAADVFVFPSYREPGGNVTLEAMAHGLPCIVTDIGGPANVVDESCGVRVHARDPQQLATDVAIAIAALAVDPERRATLGAAARRRVAALSLWDSKVDRLDDLYADLLHR